MRRILLGALALLLVAGCIWKTDRSYLGDGDSAPLQVVSTDPATGAEGVSRTPTLKVRFDQRVHPDSVGADTVRLVAGAGTGAGSVASARHVDLLDCAVSLVPDAALESALTYRFDVDGLRAMAGGLQAEPVSVTFVTGTESTAATPVAAPDLETIQDAIFRSRCASCHSGVRPPAGLDLSSLEATRSTLLDAVSPYRPGVPLVVAGRHASSYLMWKLLGVTGIWGDPMPPGDTGWPADRSCGTTDTDLRRVAAWIDGLASGDATP